MSKLRTRKPIEQRCGKNLPQTLIKMFITYLKDIHIQQDHQSIHNFLQEIERKPKTINTINQLINNSYVRPALSYYLKNCFKRQILLIKKRASINDDKITNTTKNLLMYHNFIIKRFIKGKLNNFSAFEQRKTCELKKSQQQENKEMENSNQISQEYQHEIGLNYEQPRLLQHDQIFLIDSEKQRRMQDENKDIEGLDQIGDMLYFRDQEYTILKQKNCDGAACIMLEQIYESSFQNGANCEYKKNYDELDIFYFENSVTQMRE